MTTTKHAAGAPKRASTSAAKATDKAATVSTDPSPSAAPGAELIPAGASSSPGGNDDTGAHVVDDEFIATETLTHEKARIDARAKAENESRKKFEDLMKASPGQDDFDLAKIDAAKLMLDDGRGFCIDFARPVDVTGLVRQGHDVLLKHPAITIGEGIADQFTAYGVVLLMKGEDDHVTALRCELPHAILVGGGNTAQLGADSLMFRTAR